MRKKFCLLSSNNFRRCRTHRTTFWASDIRSSLFKDLYTKRQFLSPIYSGRELNSLVMFHTLTSLHVCVWFEWVVNSLTSTALIGSLIICTLSPADICKQWERNLTDRFSRLLWGRNARRTPKNICLGGYPKLGLAVYTWGWWKKQIAAEIPKWCAQLGLSYIDSVTFVLSLDIQIYLICRKSRVNINSPNIAFYLLGNNDLHRPYRLGVREKCVYIYFTLNCTHLQNARKVYTFCAFSFS